jgi:hypothetical protein
VLDANIHTMTPTTAHKKIAWDLLDNLQTKSGRPAKNRGRGRIANTCQSQPAFLLQIQSDHALRFPQQVRRGFRQPLVHQIHQGTWILPHKTRFLTCSGRSQLSAARPQFYFNATAADTRGQKSFHDFIKWGIGGLALRVGEFCPSKAAVRC